MKNIILDTDTKKIYSSNQADKLVYEFKCENSSEKRKKPKSGVSAILRNDISTYFFDYLQNFQIPTFFIKRLSGYELLVRNINFIPITVAVYNYATHDLGKKFDLKEGIPLQFPVFEFYYLNKGNQRVFINETHVFSLGLLTGDEFKIINRLASKVNAVVKSLCDRRNLILAKMELEFGRSQNQIVLSSEISPLTLFFWHLSDDGKILRDHFVYSGDNIVKSYKEIKDRLSLKS